MTGLVLRLRPFEKLLVNGAVLQNGSRATRIRVRSSNASVLRLRDAMPPGASLTMAERIYYVAQLAVVGDADAEQARGELLQLIDAAALVAQSDTQRQQYSRARAAAEKGKAYSVMRAIRPMISERFDPDIGKR
jgi:flagellar protein FlbT